jgi:O-antigen ligase
MRTPQPINLSQRAALVEAVQPTQTGSKAPFYALLFYMLLEFGRPQDLVPGLGYLFLPMLTLIVIGLQLVKSGNVKFSNKQTILFLPLIGLMVIHGPIAANNFAAFQTFKGMVLTFIAYLGIITFVNSLRKMEMLVGLWLGIHVFLAIIGTVKGGKGVGGWLGDENDFCMQLNMVIPFAFFGLFWASNKVKKITFAGLLCLYILAGMTTLSRGGFLGMAAVGAFCWAQSSRKVLSAFLVFLLISFILLAAPDKYWSEIASITDDQTEETGTGGERLYTWEVGWDMFLANPIIGVGQGNFPWVFQEYEAGRTFNDRSIAGRAAHSAYFTLLPELGLVGVCIFVSMLYLTRRDLVLIYRSYRYRAKEGIDLDRVNDLKKAYLYANAMQASLIGYLVSSIFVSTLYYPSFWVMMGFIVALRNITVRDLANNFKTASGLSCSQSIKRRQTESRS